MKNYRTPAKANCSTLIYMTLKIHYREDEGRRNLTIPKGDCFVVPPRNDGEVGLPRTSSQ
jgi:hypothetical protein